MANIIRDDIQAQACEEINQMLSEVRLLNAAINGNGSFTISWGRKQSVVLDSSLNDRFVAILKNQRAKRIKTITNNAAKFRIQLDKDDMSVISDDIIKSAAPEKDAMDKHAHEDEDPSFGGLLNDE